MGQGNPGGKHQARVTQPGLCSRRAMTALKWTLSGALALYVGSCALLYAVQRDLLYPVPQTVRTTPTAAGFPAAQEIVLDTADGERVITWHVAPQEGKPLILFLHGNGDFLAGRVARFRAITEDGTGLLALSYRGYSGSTGHPTETGLLLDAAAAYDYPSARYTRRNLS